MNPSRYPVAVLVSGGGTNLQAILDAQDEPRFASEVVVVISDRPSVKALDRARTAGIAATVVSWDRSPDRATFSSAICDEAERHGAAALVLAGFMRVLSLGAIERFPNRIINVHPALLPAFPGGRSVPEALEYGVTVTGVTVHFVDEEVDHGPIIIQEPVAVLPDDDAVTLHARLQEVEHRVLPAVVDALGRGSLRVDGRRVTWVGR